jgi:hypothetical protein
VANKFTFRAVPETCGEETKRMLGEDHCRLPQARARGHWGAGRAPQALPHDGLELWHHVSW